MSGTSCSFVVLDVQPFSYLQSRNANKKAGGAEHRNGNHSLDSELQRLKKMREDERHEREGIVLWKRPFTTLHYFSVELCLNVHEYAVK